MNNALSRVIIPTLAVFSVFAASIPATFAASSLRLGDREAISQRREQSEIAQQINPIFGCQRLRYSPFGVIYESELRMNGYQGIMITRFFNQNTNRPEAVQQTMQVVGSPQGLVISGANPVYFGTTIRHPTYSPDNFLFQIQPNGTYSAIARDNLGRTSLVAVSDCAVG
ncbi:MAG: hypothetical protein AAGA60_32615 [Cyanobacteria bacterium P01_E01_bin.42]